MFLPGTSWLSQLLVSKMNFNYYDIQDNHEYHYLESERSYKLVSAML